MQSKAKTVEEYMKDVPEDRQEALLKLRKLCFERLISGSQSMGATLNPRWTHLTIFSTRIGRIVIAPQRWNSTRSLVADTLGPEVKAAGLGQINQLRPSLHRN